MYHKYNDLRTLKPLFFYANKLKNEKNKKTYENEFEYFSINYLMIFYVKEIPKLMVFLQKVYMQQKIGN